MSRHKYFAAVYLILFMQIVLLVFGCNKNGEVAEEIRVSRKPTGLVLINEIKTDRYGNSLFAPAGICADNSGNIYIVDAGNNRLLKFDRDFQQMREAGGYGVSEGLFNSPSYIALDNNLNLYISDGGNRRISVYDVKLNYVGMIDMTDPDDPLRFGRPSGLTVDDYGELWVTDPDNSQLLVFNSYLSFDRMVGDVKTYTDILLHPVSAAKDNRGNILVTDDGRSRIFGFKNNGVYRYEYGQDYLEKPAGIDVDKTGCVWVVDSENCVIFCFDRNGEFLYSEGIKGTGGEFGLNQPTDIAILDSDKIAVSDTGNNRVLIYRVLYSE